MNFSSYSFISLVVQNIFNNQESYQFLKNKKENSTTIRSMVYWTTIPFKRSIWHLFFSEYRSYSLKSLSHMRTLQAPLLLIIICKKITQCYSPAVSQEITFSLLCAIMRAFSHSLFSKLWLLISLEIIWLLTITFRL